MGPTPSPRRAGGPEAGRWSAIQRTGPAHGRTTGYRRNEAMVTAGAGLCLAFIRDNSPGANDTAALAETAGIPTDRHTYHPARRLGEPRGPRPEHRPGYG